MRSTTLATPVVTIHSASSRPKLASGVHLPAAMGRSSAVTTLTPIFLLFFVSHAALIIYGIFSKWFTYNDRRVVDGGVDAVAFSTVGSGRLLSFIQTAFVQLNLLFMVLVLAGVGIYLLMGR